MTVIDRTNHHLFTPLLYQVATAGLSAPAIAAPIRHILAGQRNATVLMGDVNAIDVRESSCSLEDGSAHRLRLAHRRDRLDAQLFRQRRLGAVTRRG